MFQFHSQHFSMFLVFAKKKYLKTLDWEFVHTKQEFCFWLLSSVDICITNFFQICEGFFGAFNFTNCFCYKLIKNKPGCKLFFRDFSRRGKISYNQYCISIFNSFQKLYWIWHRFIGLYICIWGRGHPRWIQEVDPRWSPCMNKEKFDSFRQKSSHFLLSHHHLFYNNFFLFNFEMHCCRRRICPNQENVKFWVWIMN